MKNPWIRAKILRELRKELNSLEFDIENGKYLVRREPFYTKVMIDKIPSYDEGVNEFNITFLFHFDTLKPQMWQLFYLEELMNHSNNYSFNSLDTWEQTTLYKDISVEGKTLLKSIISPHSYLAFLLKLSEGSATLENHTFFQGKRGLRTEFSCYVCAYMIALELQDSNTLEIIESKLKNYASKGKNERESVGNFREMLQTKK